MSREDEDFHNTTLGEAERMGGQGSTLLRAALWFRDRAYKMLKRMDALNALRGREAVPAIRGLQTACKEFTDERFPDESAAGVLEHWRDEIKEIQAEPFNLTEHADALMLHLCYLSHHGLDIQDVIAAAWAKLEINRGREWTDTGNGHYTHVPTSDKVMVCGPDCSPGDQNCNGYCIGVEHRAKMMSEWETVNDSMSGRPLRRCKECGMCTAVGNNIFHRSGCPWHPKVHGVRK